jgi:hypothetical protein
MVFKKVQLDEVSTQKYRDQAGYDHALDTSPDNS